MALRMIGLAILVGALLWPASPARAAVVEVKDGRLIYTAAPGERNDFDIASEDADPGRIHLFEYAATLSPGAGCLPDPAAAPELTSALLCLGADRGVVLVLGDGPDTAFAAGLLVPAQISLGDGDDAAYGGAAADHLNGGPGNDTLLGGAGDDQLLGEVGDDELDGDRGIERIDGTLVEELDDPGADTISGGPGNDRIRGNAGPDTLAGGEGVDTLDYGARTTPLDVSVADPAPDGAPGEGDQVTDDFETILTGHGPDRVTGSARADTINTGAGDDQIDPGPGEDVIDAGEGADEIAARDGSEDRIDCGSGVPDRVIADIQDLGSVDCESFERPPTAAASPTATISVRAKLRRISRTQVLQVQGLVRAAPCSGRVTIQIQAGRIKIKRRAAISRNCRFAVAVQLPHSARPRRVRASLGRTTSGWQVIARSRGR